MFRMRGLDSSRYGGMQNSIVAELGLHHLDNGGGGVQGAVNFLSWTEQLLWVGIVLIGPHCFHKNLQASETWIKSCQVTSLHPHSTLSVFALTSGFFALAM